MAKPSDIHVVDQTRAEKIKVLLFGLHLDGRLVTSFYNCEASVSLGIGSGFYIPHMGLPPEYLSHASAVWQGSVTCVRNPYVTFPSVQVILILSGRIRYHTLIA